MQATELTNNLKVMLEKQTNVEVAQFQNKVEVKLINLNKVDKNFNHVGHNIRTNSTEIEHKDRES